jgi:hypothetical protein
VNIPNAHNYKASLASYYYGIRLPTRFQRSHVPSLGNFQLPTPYVALEHIGTCCVHRGVNKSTLLIDCHSWLNASFYMNFLSIFLFFGVFENFQCCIYLCLINHVCLYYHSLHKYAIHPRTSKNSISPLSLCYYSLSVVEDMIDLKVAGTNCYNKFGLNAYSLAKPSNTWHKH